MRYLPLLFLFLCLYACDDEAVQHTQLSVTDTFLQHMAAKAGQAAIKATGGDSNIDCRSALYWMLITSDLSKKNKNFDTVLHIRRQTYTIAHAGDDDSLLIWINYKPNDSGTIKTLAWLQLDMNKGRLYDLTPPLKKPLAVVFDTLQMKTIRCSCMFSDKTDSAANGMTSLKQGNLQMIRNKDYSDAPDYGKVF